MHGTHGASRSGEVRRIETRQCGPLGLLGKGCQLLGGVLTEEVVRDEAVRRGFGQQARAHELAERGAGEARRNAEQVARGPERDLVTRVGAEQREGARCVRVQVPPGPGEDAPHRAVVAVHAQQAESLALLAELGDQGADPGAGAGDHQLRGDPQRQRKARALADESGGRLRVGVDALTDERANQVDGVRGRQQVDAQAHRAVPHHQAREL